MKAAVTVNIGNPDVIKFQEVPIPVVKSGWVLIKIKAFGLIITYFDARFVKIGYIYPTFNNSCINCLVL